MGVVFGASSSFVTHRFFPVVHTPIRASGTWPEHHLINAITFGRGTSGAAQSKASLAKKIGAG
jgi:hypothetical protein